MKQADYKFHRDRKKQIQRDSQENETPFYWMKSNPIFIPKNKKFKRK